MEYQCFYLDPTMQLAHADDAVPLMETDNLGEACTFVYKDWNINHRDIAVYQPRSQGYREIYRNPARDPGGRFCKR
jgi:hypothetical protein